jgi:hypothetical protein
MYEEVQRLDVEAKCMIMLAGLSDMDDERTWFEKNRAEIRQQGTGRLSVYYRKGTRTMLIFSDRNASASQICPNHTTLDNSPQNLRRRLGLAAPSSPISAAA